jgi:hypothetical protein
VAAGCVVSGIVAGIGLIGAPCGRDELVETLPESHREDPPDLGIAVSA